MIATVERPANAVRSYLPQNLFLDFLPAGWRDYVAWLVGHLYLQRHLDRRYRDDEFIPLYSQILNRILPKREYKAILDWLLNKIVETNGTYVPGVTGNRSLSKGYRLTEPYRNARFREYWLTHPELVGKLARHRERSERNFQPVHYHLKRMIEGLEVVGDYPKVYLPLVTIVNQDGWFNVCAQGRVHTALTNLDKEYREYIRWCGGQKLWSLDIKNSQPLMLALFLQRIGKAIDSNEFPSVVRKQPTATRPPANRHRPQENPPNPTHPYVGTLSNARLNEDAAKFVEDCAAGLCYERVGDCAGLTRDETKNGFFGPMYGQRSDMFTRVGRAFQQRYPACHDAIRRLKPYSRPRPKKDEPRIKDPADGELARWMQRLESDMIIVCVCERLRREVPDACLLTIHDSLVTTEEYTEYFKHVLQDEFNKAYGIKPQIRKEPFSGEPVNR